MRLAWHSAILNCAVDLKAAEQLRQHVEKQHLLKESLKFIPEHWNEDWKTGEALRYKPENDAVRYRIHVHTNRESGEKGLPPQQMHALVYIDLSQQITRHVLRTALTMCHDGLTGASPDSECNFLAAYNERAVRKHA